MVVVALVLVLEALVLVLEALVLDVLALVEEAVPGYSASILGSFDGEVDVQHIVNSLKRVG